MPEEIVNRVAQSSLVTFDLEEYYPEGRRVLLDIKEWLYEGLVLREKEFRAQVSSHNWKQYDNTFVALQCSTEAIIPAWAFMLISSHLQPFANRVVIGSLEDLETRLYQSALEGLDLSNMKGKSVIIKGCSNKPVPPNAYIWAMSKIQEVAKKVLYGEACSAVPLFRRR